MLGLLPVMLDERPVIVRQALSTLRENIKKNSKHGVRRCIKVNEAQTVKQDLFHYAPYCSAAIDYELVIKELFNFK